MRTARAVTVVTAFLAVITLGATAASAELKVSLGGYVKLDLAYEDKINNAGKFRVHPSSADVAFDKGPGKDFVKARNDQFLIEARQTRFHLTAADKVGDVTLKGFIQVDFFGGTDAESNSLVSNSSVVRMRHAYGEGTMPLGIGKLSLLAGQYWSAFMNIDAGGWNLVDFNGPSGELFSRQPQVKLTYAIPFDKDTLNLIGAVQATSVNFIRSSVLAAGVSPARQEGENIPTFVAKAQWLSSLIRAEAAGIFAQAKGIDVDGQRDERFAYGVQGTVDVIIGPLTLYGHGDALNGITREANGDFPDAVFVANAESAVRTINTYGGWGGVSYKLTPTTEFWGVYGVRTADSSGHSGFGRGANATTDLVRQQSLHVTLLQQFWQRFQFGLEFQRRWADAFRNNHGTENIYRGAFWFFF